MRFFVVALLAVGVLTGCTNPHGTFRETGAKRIAFQEHMMPRTIFAEPFDLQAFERIEKRGGTLRLYIEGRYGPFPRQYWTVHGQTPGYPIALKLASLDPHPNVVALALPCQFMGMTGRKGCDEQFRGQVLTGPVVLDAMSRAIDNIMSLYRLRSVELVGYDEGAAIAALLAVRRGDVTSLRTVAPVLDYAALGYMKGDTSITEAAAGQINLPLDFRQALARIPQHHFLGAKDVDTPFDLYITYRQSMPDDRCLTHTIVPEANHRGGFDTGWPDLLRLPVVCRTGFTDSPAPAAITAPPAFEPTEPVWSDADERNRRQYLTRDKIGPKK